MVVPTALALLVLAAIPAASEARPTSSATTIAVTVGLPKELSVEVSPAKITSPTAVFRVTNKGKLAHFFKVCTKPSASDKAQSCTGVTTKLLAPGKSAMLTVKLPASGTYEFLSGSSTQAAGGTKGFLTVTLSAASSSSSSSSSSSGSNSSSGSSGTTTTKPSSGSGGSSGGVVNGAATDPACSPGTGIPTGPNAGDEDEDNEGGFPTDGDGCL